MRDATEPITQGDGVEAELRALRESEANSRAIFALAGVGIAQADPFTCRFLRVNPRLCAITGYSERELLEMRFTDLTHPDDQARQWASFQRLICGEVAEHVIDNRYVRKDGSVVWVVAIVTLIPDAVGRPERTVAIIRDITDRKSLSETLEQQVAERTAEAERRAQQLRALTSELAQAEQRERRRLAGQLHDELGQSLALCRMKLSSMPALPAHAAAGLEEATRYLSEAVAFTRSLMSELSPPMLYELGLGAAIGVLVERMQQRHGLRVQAEIVGDESAIDDDLRATLYGAVRELLTNVIKYARTPDARVLISPTPRRVVVSVEDRGAGFDPQALTWKPTGRGGFGLFHLRERVEAMGGTIEVESAPGRGTAVTLIVPVPRAAAAPAVVTPGAEAAVIAADEVRVLLADDHKTVREGLASLLEAHAGIRVVGQAADGWEAVELALRLRPDVVVMDISMPRLNGIEATRRIKAELPTVRVIGLSMHEERHVAATLRAAGAAAYLSKGGPAEHLIDAIRGETLPRLNDD